MIKDINILCYQRIRPNKIKFWFINFKNSRNNWTTSIDNNMNSHILVNFLVDQNHFLNELRVESSIFISMQNRLINFSKNVVNCHVTITNAFNFCYCRFCVQNWVNFFLIKAFNDLVTVSLGKVIHQGVKLTISEKRIDAFLSFLNIIHKWNRQFFFNLN